MACIFTLQRYDLPWLEGHTSTLRSRFDRFGHICVSIGVHHDIPGQRRHHTSHMQHPLRVRHCSSGEDARGLAAGLLVAVAKEAMEAAQALANPFSRFVMYLMRDD